MSLSTNLMLPYLAPGQAQKHVTVNESLRRLDALVQLAAVSATTAAQPASPADGAVYILPAGKTGAAWGGFANGALAYWRDGAWVEIAPREGWLGVVKDSGALLRYSGSGWELFSATALASVSATDTLLGRATAGAGAVEEIACTAAGRALLDDADASEQRTTLGLGTAASPQLAGVNLGHASDTTLTRASAGVAAVEGANLHSDATTFARFGGSTSAFPALERNGADLRCRLADNSGYAVWWCGAIVSNGHIQAGAGSRFWWSGRGMIVSPADGQVQFANNAGSGFDSFLLGPSGTVYNRLKHVAAGELDLKLANDSDHSTLRLAHMALVERSSDPADPSEGRSILWQSNGAGAGDDGDIMMKVTAGGVTKLVTLVDFSAA